MPDFSELAGIGFFTILLLLFFMFLGLKGAAGVLFCILILTTMAGVFSGLAR